VFKEKEPCGLILPLLKLTPSSEVTVCVWASSFFHIIVFPSTIVMAAGEKPVDWMLTRFVLLVVTVPDEP